ncbi:MAG: LEA type 2 family protein [Bacteroidales bacterium]|nr:LEA type 2 family protein [Bacteroidales bacterium]
MRKNKVFWWIISLVFILFSCGIVSQVKRLSNCSFEFDRIENFKLAQVNLDKIQSANDFNLSDAAKIMAALSSQKAELSFDVKIRGHNPDSKPASVDKMDYIILLEGKELARGNLDKKFTIPAKGSTPISFNIQTDALKLIEKNTIKDLYALYENITKANKSNSSTVGIKVKPTINNYTFPSYITLKKKI